MVALAHGFLLLEAGVLAAGAEHGGGALLLQHTTIAQTVEPGGQVEHRDGLAAAGHQRPAEHLAEPACLAGLTDQNGTRQPLNGLLDARQVDAEQHLRPRFGGGAELLHRRGVAQAVALGAVEMSIRIHGAEERFQLFLHLVEVVFRLNDGQIAALGIGQDAGHQGDGVLGLPHRPVDLLVLCAQRVGLRGQVQVLDPGAEQIHLPLLRPEHRGVVRRHRQGAQRHSLADRHPGDDRPFKQFRGRLAFLVGAVGHRQAQQLCLRAQAEQLLGRFCPAGRRHLVVAVEDQVVRLARCQPDPLLGRRLGQHTAVAEDEVLRQHTIVVAADILPAQGQPRRTVHQPDERRLRMVRDELPCNAALARAGGMFHRRFSVSFQRSNNLCIRLRIDLVQTDRHCFYTSRIDLLAKSFSYKSIMAKNTFLSSIPGKKEDFG